MKNTPEPIILNVKTADPHEYIESFRDSVLETLMLLFERRELDLGEAQLYSLYRLVQAAISIQVQAATIQQGKVATAKSG